MYKKRDQREPSASASVTLNIETIEVISAYTTVVGVVVSGNRLETLHQSLSNILETQSVKWQA